MKALFRAIAFDETQYWSGLPKDCTRVFGIYLFREAERTYCCSLMPSSRCEPLNNVFCGLASEDPFVEDNEFDVREDCMYVPLIDSRKPSTRKWISRTIEVEADSDEEAWEEALEQARGNEPQIPGVSRAWLAAHPD